VFQKEEVSLAEHRALCLVNKACRTVAEPFLYSKVQWTLHNDYPDHSPPFRQLLRTLLSKPHLATYIKTLHLDGNTRSAGLNTFRWDLPKIPISGDEVDESIAFIRQTGVPYSDILRRRRRRSRILTARAIAR
jgi:hypothetical protein